MHRPSVPVGWLVASCAWAACGLVPSSALASTAVQLRSVATKAKPAALVTFAGRAGGRRGARVTIERRVGASWRRIASGRTGTHGRFALTWVTPSQATRVVVRARLGAHSSTSRRFRVLAPAKGAHRVVVSPKAQVISASVVRSVPAPGTAGSITYAGGNDTAVGKIIVVGQGAGTPTGFIGRVTSVQQQGGQTVARTVPATLLQAVTQGGLDVVAKSVSASRSAPRSKSTISCEGSAGLSITPDVTFGAGLALKADWTLFGGLQDASLTANADLDASLAASIAAAGSCSIAPRTLLRAKGPGIDTFVGPIPVVITSELHVDADATASAQAGLSTDANAGFTASAGVAYTKAGGFQGTESFTPHFGFDPPSLSASASVAAHVVPAVDVLLYGLAGPEIALRTGLEFDADTTQDPWWTLSVPVDLSAAITIPALDLTSPELHVYQHAFPIADAGGAFAPGGGTVTPPPPPPLTATPGTSVAAGYDFSCALRASGAAACWGANGHGQLGKGSAGSSPTPVAVSGITDAVALAGGYQHACALRTGGTVLCWGANDSGQLGTGSQSDEYHPTAVSGLTNAVAIAAGESHTCAVLTTGRVDCWGADDQHELGDGSTSQSSTPTPVSGITNATAIAANTYHTCALLRTGQVSCWGDNSAGALGDGNTNPSAVPVTVTGVSDALGVAAGAGHSCALHQGGTISCWGQDGYGQLGDGLQDSSGGTPVTVTGITDATQVTAGYEHTCARLQTGSLACWGDNEYGQVGDGSDQTAHATPVAVSGITDATAVAAGYEHTCAMRTSGALACWGYGSDGELGTGSTSTAPTPVAVTGFP